MTATIDISISSSEWTLVVPNGSAGLVSNVSGTPIYTRKEDSLPAASVEFGHPSLSMESINADLTDAAETGSLYARVNPKTGKKTGLVVFTEN